MPKKKPSPHGGPDGIYPPRRKPPFASVDELLKHVEDQPTLLETLDRISSMLRQILRLPREPDKAKLLAAFPWLQTLTGADPMDPEIQADAREASRRLQGVRGVVAMEVDELTLTRSQLLNLVKDAMALGRAVEWLHVRGFEAAVIEGRKSTARRRKGGETANEVYAELKQPALKMVKALMAEGLNKTDALSATRAKLGPAERTIRTWMKDEESAGDQSGTTGRR